jgi:hypothetical protein
MRRREIGILGCAALAGVVGAFLAGRSEHSGGAGTIDVAAYTQVAAAQSANQALRARVARLAEHAPPGIPGVPAVSAVPAQGVPFTSVRVSSSGRVWRFVVYRSDEGAWCSAEEMPGGGVGSGCFTRSPMPPRVMRVLGVGNEPALTASRNPAGVYASVRVEGYAPPSIARLDMLGMDCKPRPVALGTNGAFFAVFDRHELVSGGWPYVLRGYDAQGRVVDQVRITGSASNPPPAFVAGVTVPRAACSSLAGVRDLGS